MALSKRPRGPEIEARVDEVATRKVFNHDWEDEAHFRVVGRVKKLESDLALLMAHLKLEFRDIPSVPGKRVVGNATKKKKSSHVPVSMTASQYMAQSLVDAAANQRGSWDGGKIWWR